MSAQPTLFYSPVQKDIVYTPDWLAREIVDHFAPTGTCLDPCAGDGAFLNRLPLDSDWCEIQRGRDFYQWTKPVNWIVSNPPYSELLKWIRHSFTVADNIVYLIPLHRAFASYEFVMDLRAYGGTREIFVIGTGATAGFPFGHLLCAVHYQRDWHGPTTWSFIGENIPTFIPTMNLG